MNATATSQELIDRTVADSAPEPLTGAGKSPITGDHAAHVVQLSGWGQTALAADHLLFPELNGSLFGIVGAVIRQLDITFMGAARAEGDSVDTIAGKIRQRQYAYETLLEMAINFAGMESRWLDEEERADSVAAIRSVLAEWEALEAAEGDVSIAAAVIRRFVGSMKLVQGGISMVARTAARIEESLDFSQPLLLDFLDKCVADIEANVYTRMVREGYCRFGNDYALGLRWLRHLGFEQVSTNPVLARLAYKDDPALNRAFQGEVTGHRKFAEWKTEPAKYADEIALYATLLALWDNLHVFRPIFFNLAPTTGGGVVSFQLNPNIADRAEESVQDVFSAFAEAAEDLKVYDDYLLAGYTPLVPRSRPNIVIKVAAAYPAAREIGRRINTFGFGSNITVIYSSGQEVTMILEELAGMAAAVKKGVVPTQLYMTNMGGRFESHLREVKLENYFAAAKEQLGEDAALARVQQLADANGTRAAVDAASGFGAKAFAATRFGNQKTLDANVVAALEGVVSADELAQWEAALGKSGTLVARRVWGIFFAEENRGKWLDHLCERYGLTRKQAELVFSRVCYLPASKRKPEDTFWTLAGKNFVHTEFPNHQENVRKAAEQPGFRLEDFRESITAEFDSETVQLLNTVPDFRAGYELNAELNEILAKVGIEGDFGSEGVTPEQWSEFGPVAKTLVEFKGAYDGFSSEIMALFVEAAK